MLPESLRNHRTHRRRRNAGLSRKDVPHRVPHSELHPSRRGAGAHPAGRLPAHHVPGARVRREAVHLPSQKAGADAGGTCPARRASDHGPRRRAIARAHRGGGPWRHSQAAHRHDADRRRVRGGPAPRPLSGRPTRHSGHRALGRNPAPDGAPRRGNHRLRLRGRALRQGPLCLTPLLVRAFGAHLRGRASLPAYATHPGRPLGRTTHSARGGQRQPQRACPRARSAQSLACLLRRSFRRGKPRYHQDIRPGRSWDFLRLRGRRAAEVQEGTLRVIPSPMRASSTTSASFTCATASTSRIWKIFSRAPGRERRSKHSFLRNHHHFISAIGISNS